MANKGNLTIWRAKTTDDGKSIVEGTPSFDNTIVVRKKNPKPQKVEPVVKEEEKAETDSTLNLEL